MIGETVDEPAGAVNVPLNTSPVSTSTPPATATTGAVSSPASISKEKYPPEFVTPVGSFAS